MAPQKQLSVVVPTYDETDNLRPLTERLFKAAPRRRTLDCDLLFADDESRGSDASQKIVARVGALTVRLETAPSARAGASPQLYCWASRARSTTPCCAWTRTCNTSPKVLQIETTRPSRTGLDFSVGLSHVGGGGVGFGGNVVRVIISAGATLRRGRSARRRTP